MTSVELKRNDRQPYLYIQVTDSDGNPVSLVGCAVVFTMKRDGDGLLAVNRASTGVYITDAANGEMEYRWQDSDTAESGMYACEFEVTPPSGGKFTVPAKTKERITIIINEDLDGV